MMKLDPNSGNTTFASSETLGLVSLSSELLKASAPNAFWKTLKPGVLVDCQDSKRGHWIKSKIVDINELGQCLVHFQGWAKKWDEWYAIDSDHVAKAGTFTDQSAPVVDEVIQQDEKTILKATAFRVKSSVTLYSIRLSLFLFLIVSDYHFKVTLPVTTGVQLSSKRLGALPSGMVVFVTDKHVNEKGMVERLFFEQTTNMAVPAKGWVSLRRPAGGSFPLLCV